MRKYKVKKKPLLCRLGIHRDGFYNTVGEDPTGSAKYYFFKTYWCCGKCDYKEPRT